MQIVITPGAVLVSVGLMALAVLIGALFAVGWKVASTVCRQLFYAVRHPSSVVKIDDDGVIHLPDGRTGTIKPF